MKGITRKHAIAALALILLWSTSAIGAPVPISLTFEVASVDAGVTEFAVGDRFTLDFVIEDSTTDTAGSTGAGQFPGLLTSFDATADPANTGAWMPSGAYSSGSSNFVTNAFGNNLTLQIHGTGYPDGGAGLTFHDFDLGFGWPPGITDSGTGDTFAEQLGATFALPPAVLGGSRIRFTDGLYSFPATNLVLVPQALPVPTPVSTLGNMGLILLALLLAAIATMTFTRRMST